MTRTTSRPARVAGSVPGALLGVASAVTGALRRDKALHPIGHRGAGRLEITDPDAGLGIAVLAEAGAHACDVRWSRSMGLPWGLPDIEGLALRLPGAGPDGADADLLLASRGANAVTRHLLTLRRQGRYGAMTTLLPVRAGGRPVVFGVSPAGGPAGELPPTAYTLEVAGLTGPWRPLGRLDVSWSRDDVRTRYDPVANPLAGTEQYPFVVALREPAYVAARAVTRARGRRT